MELNSSARSGVAGPEEDVVGGTTTCCSSSMERAAAPRLQAHGGLLSSVDAPAAGLAGLRLTVRIDRRSIRRWHILLLRQLAHGHTVTISVDTAEGAAPVGPGLSLLFGLERLLHGASSTGLSAAATTADLADVCVASVGVPDLTLDLCGDRSAAEGRVWTLAFDGQVGEPALLRALLDGRVPLVEVREGSAVVVAGRPGTESGGIVRAALEDVWARITTLLLAALSGAACADLPSLPGSAEAPGNRVPRGLVGFAAREVVSNATRRIYRACYHAPHWRTGWRRLDGPDLYDLRRHPDAGWQNLPDDGRRFYADPFPVEHGGKVTLFVEDFEHRIGKGIISAVEFGPDGPLGTPRPVLEQPTHLSYPFVFEHDGDMWMIPESGGAGTVDLFRATAFPGGWKRERTLLSGLVASDATLVRHEGLWWMFATVMGTGGAFSDALHLWYAEDLLGPWQPHARNPVLIDIASARPAGRIVRRGDALFRPVQDCRSGYGAGLGIARITRLDPDGFRQEIETILTAGQLWAGRRLHTLNAAGRFEFIDGSAYAPRWAGLGSQSAGSLTNLQPDGDPGGTTVSPAPTNPVTGGSYR